MIRCQKCGSELREGAKFCSKCGAKLTLISPEVTAEIDILKKKIEKDPLNPKLYVELGTIYHQNSLPKEALIEYQKAASIDDSNYEAHLTSGHVYLELDELEKAENSYRKALSLNPKSPECKLGLFTAYYQQNKLEDAMKFGEEIIETQPDNIEAHKTLKEIYLKKGMKEKAFKELETITNLMPKDKESLRELAYFCAEINENEKELKYYQKVMELDPEDIETRFNIGEAFCAKGDYQNTIKHLKDIVRKLPNPLQPYAHLYLALSYISLRDLDNAIEQITMVSSVDYEDLTARDKKLFAQAYYQVGCAVLQNKRFSSAIDYLEKAIKNDPENVEYRKELDAVRTEQARSRSKVRRKRITLAIGAIVVALVLFAGWYLSHGKIQLQITPPEDAKVYIDGKPFEGATALKPGVILTPSLFFGVHKITVEKDGYEKWEKNIKVGYGRINTVEAILFPLYGSLKLNSKPSGAEVYLEDKLIGKTPLILKRILARDYSLKLIKEDYRVYTSTATIPAEGVLSLDIVLRKILAWKLEFEKQLFDGMRPVIVNDIMYLGAYASLYALDAKTGRLEWVFNEMGNWVHSQVAANGVVYAVCQDNRLYAVDTRSRKLKWKFILYENENLILYPNPYPSPAIADEVVYCGNNDGLFGIDINTGKLKWKYNKSVTGDPILANDVIYFGDQRGLNALDVKSLQLRWRFETKGEVRGSPAIGEGIIYFGSADKHFYAVDLNTGQLRWKFETREEIRMAPVIAYGTVFFVSGGRLFAMDSKTGDYRWGFSAEKAGWSPVIAEAIIYFGSMDKHLYAIDIKTGELKWKFETKGPASCPPVISNGMVYFFSNDEWKWGRSHIYAMSLL